MAVSVDGDFVLDFAVAFDHRLVAGQDDAVAFGLVLGDLDPPAADRGPTPDGSSGARPALVLDLVPSRLAAIFGGDGDGHGVLRLGLRLGCRRKRRDGRRGGMRRDGLAGRGDMGLSAIKVLQLELE